MKKQRNRLGFIISLFFLLLWACNDDHEANSGEGRLALKVRLQEKTTEIVSKAAIGNPEEDATIIISNSDGNIYQYSGISQIPDEIWLVSGNYTVSVIGGDSVVAGFNTPYYKGTEDFTITSGVVNTISLEGRIANTLLTTYFTDNLTTELSEYEVKAYNIQNTGELIYNQSNEGVSGYYMMSPTVTDIYWTFTGKTVDGNSFEKSDVLRSVKSCTNYIMTFDFDSNYEDGGGILIGIEVAVMHENPDEDDVVTIKMPPSITVNGSDVRDSIFRPEGSLQDLQIWINGSSELKNILFKTDNDSRSTLGLPSLPLQFDFAQMTELDRNQFASQFKIEYIDNNGEKNVWRILITFSSDLMVDLPVNETFSFTIYAEDINGFKKERELNVKISNTLVQTDDIIDYEVWTTRATLRGTVSNVTDEDIYFLYKEVGTIEYTTTSIVKSGTSSPGDKFEFEITGLTPGTQYEFRAIAGSNQADIKYFNTEVASQLPNSGFEDWQELSERILLGGFIPTTVNFWGIYGEGQAKFWDSGNLGSASVGPSVTTPDETVYIAGKKSAKLKSEYVVIKFAAGNLFAGEFVQLIGTNGAELSFGREFESRPKSLKFWYKYEPVTIDRVGGGLPQDLIDEGAANGKLDKAHVYIALGDWDKPVKIDNTDLQNGLFNVNDPHIIAYGEMVEDEATTGGYRTINLDYRNYTRKPKYIIVVATSSKYGDYFTGGEGSTLWLDDFELIYE